MSRHSPNETEPIGWKPFAIAGAIAALWLTGFDRKWFGFGPWTSELPAGYPPSGQEFLTGVVLTGLAAGWSFGILRHGRIAVRVFGWFSFAYFYLHAITLAYMADPDLFIWSLFRGS